jgi:hypothetical protein
VVRVALPSPTRAKRKGGRGKVCPPTIANRKSSMHLKTSNQKSHIEKKCKNQLQKLGGMQPDEII